MKNKKGFTLIELLAVIVILSVILALAIPAVAKYISSSKKGTYIANAQSYASAARNELFLNNSDFALPTSNGQATVISFKELLPALESGGKKSPYGAPFVDQFSYVVILNNGTAEKPVYSYYIAALDEKGYGIGTETNVPAPILYDELEEANIRQLGKVGVSASEGSLKAMIEGLDKVTNCYPETLCAE